jgi:hypothetical protein
LDTAVYWFTAPVSALLHRPRSLAPAGLMCWNTAHQPENTMKKLLIATCLGLLLAAGAHAQKSAQAPVVPASAAKAPSAQQSLMATCNKEATGKKGEERKAFMKTCLADGKKQQQERMKSCNAEAKGTRGDARKAFMSECLKK